MRMMMYLLRSWMNFHCPRRTEEKSLLSSNLIRKDDFLVERYVGGTSRSERLVQPKQEVLARMHIDNDEDDKEEEESEDDEDEGDSEEEEAEEEEEDGNGGEGKSDDSTENPDEFPRCPMRKSSGYRRRKINSYYRIRGIIAHHRAMRFISKSAKPSCLVVMAPTYINGGFVILPTNIFKSIIATLTFGLIRGVGFSVSIIAEESSEYKLVGLNLCLKII